MEAVLGCGSASQVIRLAVEGTPLWKYLHDEPYKDGVEGRGGGGWTHVQRFNTKAKKKLSGSERRREMGWSMGPVDMLLPSMELRLKQPRHAVRPHTTPPALVGAVATDARLVASSSTTLLQIEQVVRTHHDHLPRLGPSYLEKRRPRSSGVGGWWWARGRANKYYQQLAPA